MFCEKLRQESHRYHKSVSQSLTSACNIWALALYAFPGLTICTLGSRLLEVYRRLRNIDAAVGEEAAQNDLIEEAKSIIGDICADHTAAAEQFVSDPELKEGLKQDVKNECQELVEYIQASKRFKLEINSRSKDRVVSFGERLSCRFMTYVLRDRVRTFFSTRCVVGSEWGLRRMTMS